jgi:rare lipoprotein A
MPVIKKTIKRALLCAMLLLNLGCMPLLAMAKPITVSWYGRQHAGKRMANGQKFDPRKLTAAHRKLPFGTRVRLFCLKTGKSVVVTITDRGPFKKKRTMDVSEQAAKDLGIRGAGIARVDMEILP